MDRKSKHEVHIFIHSKKGHFFVLKNTMTNTTMTITTIRAAISKASSGKNDTPVGWDLLIWLFDLEERLKKMDLVKN